MLELVSAKKLMTASWPPLFLNQLKKMLFQCLPTKNSMILLTRSDTIFARSILLLEIRIILIIRKNFENLSNFQNFIYFEDFLNFQNFIFCVG